MVVKDGEDFKTQIANDKFEKLRLNGVARLILCLDWLDFDYLSSILFIQENPSLCIKETNAF